MKQLLLVLLALITFSLLVADTMPDFRLPDMNNQDVSLSDLLGKGPVLIDFWAIWCKNCTMMDKTTLKDETIQNALSELIFIKYQAERFDDPATQALLEHFHVLGLPTYVILTPNPENPAQ